MNKNLKYKFLEEELYKLRKSKGLSQEELAEKINVSRQSIHLWESGKIIPDMENIMNICNVLNVTPNQLISGLNSITSTTKTVNMKKIIKNIILVIVIFLIIYLIISFRKSLILLKLDKKTQEFSTLNNYSYVEHYTEEKDFTMTNNYTRTVYYKDGTYVENYKEFSNNNVNRDDTLWIDRNQRKAYYIDNNNNTCQERNADEFAVPEKEMIYSIAKSSRIVPKNNFINILYGFNPNFNIENKKDQYITTLYNQVGNLKLKIYEHIDKESGLVNSIFTYYPDGKVTTKLYEIKINETQDDDIIIPDLNTYNN